MRQTWFALLLIATTLGRAHAADNDFIVVGGMDFGFKELRLDTRTVSDNLESSFLTINPNIALGYESFYASLSYDRSVSADPRYSENAAGTGGFITEFSRTDTTFTLGYRVSPSFSLFAGYTEGVNTFTVTGAALSLFVRKIEYTESGPFAGIAYSNTFGDKGALGISVGYADLDGELSVRDYGPGSSVDAKVKGDTTGLSYTLAWTGSLTGSLGYRVGAKLTEYEMDEPAKINERYTSFFLGIMNYF